AASNPQLKARYANQVPFPFAAQALQQQQIALSNGSFMNGSFTGQQDWNNFNLAASLSPEDRWITNPANGSNVANHNMYNGNRGGSVPVTAVTSPNSQTQQQVTPNNRSQLPPAKKSTPTTSRKSAVRAAVPGRTI